MKLWQFVTICVVAFWLLLFGYWRVAEPAELHGDASIGYDIEKDLTFTTVELNYEFDIWKLNNYMWIGADTYFITSDFIPKAMTRAVFPIGYKIAYKSVFLQIEHFCTHSFYREVQGYKWSNEHLEHYNWNSSGTKISAGVQW